MGIHFRAGLPRACVAALAISFLAFSPAFAGLIPSSVKVGFSPPGPPPWAGQGGPPPFVFGIVPDQANLPGILLEEEFVGMDPLNLAVSGTIANGSGGTPITIVKEITNATGTTWLGFDIGVNDDVTFVPGSASSTVFTSLVETPNLLSFGLPSPVASGEAVSFSFQILIPEGGNFSFDLMQSAIVPEPASIVLMVLGAGALYRVRRFAKV